MSTLQKKFIDLKKKIITKAKKIIYKANDPAYNVFKKDYKKYALVSYISAPFKIGNDFRHNNEIAVREIAQFLDELGYVVDVMHYEDNREYNFEKYSAIIGFGNPFCNSFKTNSHAKRIYYSTGMEISFQNYATIKRLKEFHAKHKIWLPESARIVDQAWSLQTQAVDGIISYGNKTVFDSYRKYFDGPISPLHDPGFKFRDSQEVLSEKKDWAQARNNFFFSFGAGAIHKGLDLVLDLFAKHPEWKLHITSPTNKETRFLTLYKDILALPNIHHYGFVTHNPSQHHQYLEITSKCGFYLSPSASEGCPTTTINCCSNSKCIPIANAESGLEGDFVIPISELTPESLEKAILKAQRMTDAELETTATAAYDYFTSVHTLDNYRKELRTGISGILENGM